MLLTMKLIDALGRRTLLLLFLPAMGIAHLGLAAALASMGQASGAGPAVAAVASICG